MDEMQMSKVYIQTDSGGRITRCEGGYTMSNIADLSEWVYIDEGTGDRYNLCQSHYFEGGLYTEDGYCQWGYENGECRERTAEEIEADRETADRRKWQAPRDFEPGELMTVEGNLYRVILPIFAGAQITPGTNAETTTLEAEVARLNEEEKE